MIKTIEELIRPENQELLEQLLTHLSDSGRLYVIQNTDEGLFQLGLAKNIGYIQDPCNDPVFEPDFVDYPD